MSNTESTASVFKNEPASISEFAGNEHDFVQIRGQVRVPGEYLFKEGSDILYYLAKAGGPAAKQALETLMIMRCEGGSRRAQTFDLRKIRQMPEVKRGDILVFHALAAPEKTQNVIKRHAPLLLASKEAAAPADNSVPLEEYIRGSRFKRLLNQVVALQAEQNLKSIAVLSAGPGQGKTFLAAALALGHARFLSSRVLLVDTVHQPRNRSLRLERLISRNGSNGAEGSVDLLTTRSLEGGEQESNDFRLSNELRAWSEEYDVVLVDTCAIDSADENKIDPVIVGSQVDGAFLVTTKAVEDRVVMRQIAAMLKRSRVRLKGVIYNEI